MNAASTSLAFDERLPTEIESSNAESLLRIIASQVAQDGDTVINVAVEGGKTFPVTLTPTLAHSFLEVLRLVSSGRGFRLIPLDSKLTTQQAADILNVSRPHLIKLLEEGHIPFDRVGRHRRIKAGDLMAFKEKRDTERAAALEDMAAFDGATDLL